MWKGVAPRFAICPACGQAVIPASIEQEANSSPKPETPETFSEEPIQENNPQERKPQESEPQEYTSSDEEACENPFVVVESCYQKGNVQSEAYLNAHQQSQASILLVEIARLSSAYRPIYCL